MVNEFCGFKHGVIGTDKMPSDATLNNMEKADLIKLLHTAQHNYETLIRFHNNAVIAIFSQLNNDGWIPCSSGILPESGKENPVTKDYYKYPCIYKNGDVVDVRYLAFGRGNWLKYGKVMNKYVVAWFDIYKSLPAPYQPKGE